MGRERRGRSGILVALAVSGGLVVGHPAVGQESENRSEPSVGTAAVGAVVGGALGLVGGLALGASSGDSYAGLALGGLLGQLVGAPLGAHLLNHGRGSLLADLGVSAGWIAAGLLLDVAVDSADDEAYVISTIGQLIGVAVTEVRTSPSIEPTTAVRPSPEGTVVEIGFRVR